MRKIILVVENLNIGGVQRIALDEAYQLSTQGEPATIIVLNNPFNYEIESFTHIEKQLIKKYNVEIIYIKGTKFDKIKGFRALINQANLPIIFWSHSLTATALISFARFGLKKNVNLATTIHQIPALTDPKQRFKRYIYSLFSDVLFVFSKAAKMDWERRLKFIKCLPVLNKRQLIILRNGVFLPRLPEQAFELQLRTPKLRLVYLGRISKWKGLDLILELALTPQLIEAEILLIIPSLSPSLHASIPVSVRNRITFQTGTAFNSYTPRSGDVHLYPTNYGSKALFWESISINCLEMACVGIPSLVSQNGLATWPEFKNSELFLEVDWNNSIMVAETIINNFEKTFSKIKIDEIKKIVDVKNHVHVMLETFK